MRKIICKILLFFIIVTTSVPIITKANPSPAAEAVVLMDAKTGKIIFSKNPQEKFLPASTTKVLTALVVLNNCKLDEEVIVGKNPPYADGSSLGIKEGEVYTVEELLIGLLLTSGNDTAEALAEYVSGSVEEFGKLMTKTAHELGAVNSNFTNPSGLDEITQNYTTAEDLALIMKKAITYPDFVRICQIDAYQYKDKPYTDGTERWAVSGNRVMRNWSSWYSPYVTAGKTGYTDAAHHTYVASAEKDGQTLIAALIKGQDKNAFYSSVAPLFEYGFNNFETTQVVKKHEKLVEYKINDNITIPLLSDKDYYITKARNDNSKNIVSIDYEDRDISKKPIKTYDELFKGSLLVNGEKIDDITLISGADREYNSKIARREFFAEMLKNKNFIFASGLFLLFILFTLLRIRKTKRHKKLNKLREKYNIKK